MPIADIFSMRSMVPSGASAGPSSPSLSFGLDPTSHQSMDRTLGRFNTLFLSLEQKMRLQMSKFASNKAVGSEALTAPKSTAQAVSRLERSFLESQKQDAASLNSLRTSIDNHFDRLEKALKNVGGGGGGGGMPGILPFGRRVKGAMGRMGRTMMRGARGLPVIGGLATAWGLYDSYQNRHDDSLGTKALDYGLNSWGGAQIGGVIGAAIGGPVGAAVGAVVGSLAGAGATYIARNWDSIMEGLGSALRFNKTHKDSINKGYAELKTKVADSITDAFKDFVTGPQNMFTHMFSSLKEMYLRQLDRLPQDSILHALGLGMYKVPKSIFDTISGWLSSAWKWIKGKLSGVVPGGNPNPNQNPVVPPGLRPPGQGGRGDPRYPGTRGNTPGPGRGTIPSNPSAPTPVPGGSAVPGQQGAIPSPSPQSGGGSYSGSGGGNNQDYGATRTSLSMPPRQGNSSSGGPGPSGDSSRLIGGEGEQTMGALGINRDQMDAYRRGVAGIESSGGRYDLIGGSHNRYSGAYQFGPGEIASTARRLNESAPTREQFLADPKMQERYLDDYTKWHHDYLMKNSEAYKNLSPTQKLQVLGYAHNQGQGGAKKFLETGRVGRDAFGTEGTRYMGAIDRELKSIGTRKTASLSNENPATASIPKQDPASSQSAAQTLDMLKGSNKANPSTYKDAMSPNSLPFAPNYGKVQYDSADQLKARSEHNRGLFGLNRHTEEFDERHGGGSMDFGDRIEQRALRRGEIEREKQEKKDRIDNWGIPEGQRDHTRPWEKDSLQMLKDNAWSMDKRMMGTHPNAYYQQYTDDTEAGKGLGRRQQNIDLEPADATNPRPSQPVDAPDNKPTSSNQGYAPPSGMYEDPSNRTNDDSLHYFLQADTTPA